MEFFNGTNKNLKNTSNSKFNYVDSSRSNLWGDPPPDNPSGLSPRQRALRKQKRLSRRRAAPKQPKTPQTLEGTRQPPSNPPKGGLNPAPRLPAPRGGLGGGLGGGLAIASKEAKNLVGGVATSTAGKLTLGGTVAWTVLSFGDLTSEEQEQEALDRERRKQNNKNAGLNLSAPRTYSTDSTGPPPFTGGQAYGVTYIVTVLTQAWRIYQDFRGTQFLIDSVTQRQVTGRVIGVEWGDVGGAQGFLILYQPSQGGQIEKMPAGPSVGSAFDGYAGGILSITRLDGLPDTSGNPPPPQVLFTTNNNYNTNNYYQNNINNYSDDTPFTPAQIGAIGGLANGGFNPASTNSNSTNTGSSLDGLKNPQPGLQAPTLAGNEQDPTKQTNNDPNRLPSVSSPGFSPSNFGTKTYTKDDPVLNERNRANKSKQGNQTQETSQNQTGFPGLSPFPALQKIPTLQDQTKLETDPTDGTIKPPPTDTSTKNKNTPESPSSYDLPDMMGKCCAGLSQQNKANSDKLDQTNNKLDALNTGLNIGETGGIAAVLQKLNAMDAWLIAKFAALWQHRIIDRALATFTFILTLHNAAQLSANLFQSLGSTIDLVVGIFFKDVDGNPFPVSQILGNTFQGWVQSAIGEHNYKTVADGFKKANRILTATTNLFDSVKAGQSAIAEGLEVIGGWVGKLNNDMVREGLFSESVGYRDESPEFKTHLVGAQQVIENLTQATESINQLASAVIETQESVTQINANFAALKTEIGGKEETKKTEEEDKTTESSTNATITNLDLVEGRDDAS